jgi:hypothetical protein
MLLTTRNSMYVQYMYPYVFSTNKKKFFFTSLFLINWHRFESAPLEAENVNSDLLQRS